LFINTAEPEINENSKGNKTEPKITRVIQADKNLAQTIAGILAGVVRREVKCPCDVHLKNSSSLRAAK
jgi:hypothetical protein